MRAHGANLPGLITCPACGLSLPEFARFCARCGRRLPLRGDVPPTWVLVLFWLGTVASLAVAVAYTLILVIPGLPAQGIDSGQLRRVSGIVAAAAASLFVAQLITSVGLMLGRSWAKGMATLRDDGALKVLAGETTIAEVLRSTQLAMVSAEGG